MRFRVTCPCCKGAKYLKLHDEALEQVTLILCIHCEGEGTVRSETLE